MQDVSTYAMQQARSNKPRMQNAHLVDIPYYPINRLSLEGSVDDCSVLDYELCHPRSRLYCSLAYFQDL